MPRHVGENGSPKQPVSLEEIDQFVRKIVVPGFSDLTGIDDVPAKLRSAFSVNQEHEFRYMGNNARILLEAHQRLRNMRPSDNIGLSGLMFAVAVRQEIVRGKRRITRNLKRGSAGTINPGNSDLTSTKGVRLLDLRLWEVSEYEFEYGKEQALLPIRHASLEVTWPNTITGEETGYWSSRALNLERIPPYEGVRPVNIDEIMEEFDKLAVASSHTLYPEDLTFISGSIARAVHKSSQRSE